MVREAVRDCLSRDHLNRRVSIDRADSVKDSSRHETVFVACSAGSGAALAGRFGPLASSFRLAAFEAGQRGNDYPSSARHCFCFVHRISTPFVPSLLPSNPLLMTGLPPSPHPSNPRKRTTSFSEPLSRKTSRMMLRRTDSFLSLSDLNDDSHVESGSFLHMTSEPVLSPRIAHPSRARIHIAEQRDATKLGRKRAEFTIAPAPSSTPKRVARAAPCKPQPHPAVPLVRTTSPLAPTRKLLPPRVAFPRSKPEPDLYRMALKGRMRSSPEGEKILRMGPRLAIGILSATRELERIVSAHEDDDVTMDEETGIAARSVIWGLGREMVAVPCGA